MRTSRHLGSNKRKSSLFLNNEGLHSMAEGKTYLRGGNGMDKFEKVTIVKKANIYFDGKVTSRTVLFENGEKKTLGIMLPGEYEFGTSNKEIMEIIQGKLEVKLPGSNNWRTFTSGESFEVSADSKFNLIVNETTDYCCSYIER